MEATVFQSAAQLAFAQAQGEHAESKRRMLEIRHLMLSKEAELAGAKSDATHRSSSSARQRSEFESCPRLYVFVLCF